MYGISYCQEFMKKSWKGEKNVWTKNTKIRKSEWIMFVVCVHFMVGRWTNSDGQLCWWKKKKQAAVAIYWSMRECIFCNNIELNKLVEACCMTTALNICILARTAGRRSIRALSLPLVWIQLLLSYELSKYLKDLLHYMNMFECNTQTGNSIEWFKSRPNLQWGLRSYFRYVCVCVKPCTCNMCGILGLLCWTINHDS